GARAAPRRRPLRPGDDVHRRRPGHRRDLRAGLGEGRPHAVATRRHAGQGRKQRQQYPRATAARGVRSGRGFVPFLSHPGERGLQNPTHSRNGWVGSASSRNASSSDTVTSSGLITFAPWRMAKREPRRAPSTWPAPITRPTFHSTAPDPTNTANAPRLEPKLRNLVWAVALRMPNPARPTKPSIRNEPVPGPNTPS